MIVRLPSETLRDDLALAVTDAVAARTSVPRLSIRDIRVLDSAVEPSLGLVIRSRDITMSSATIRAETESVIREYAGRLDLNRISIVVQSD